MAEKKSILDKIEKRLEDLKTSLVEDEPELMKELDELTKRLKKIEREKEKDYSPMETAKLNLDIDELEKSNELTKQEDIIRQKLIYERNVSQNQTVEEEEEKQDIPLFRVHNSLITERQTLQTMPVITYYRVNGSAGRLEETLRIAGISNKRSIYGAGESFE